MIYPLYTGTHHKAKLIFSKLLPWLFLQLTSEAQTHLLSFTLQRRNLEAVSWLRHRRVLLCDVFWRRLFGKQTNYGPLQEESDLPGTLITHLWGCRKEPLHLHYLDEMSSEVRSSPTSDAIPIVSVLTRILTGEHKADEQITNIKGFFLKAASRHEI